MSICYVKERNGWEVKETPSDQALEVRNIDVPILVTAIVGSRMYSFTSAYFSKLVMLIPSSHGRN